MDEWEKLLKFALVLTYSYSYTHQVLLLLGELFPAVQAAENAVHFDPTWCTAYQTLGRAQLGIGEINMVSVYQWLL